MVESERLARLETSHADLKKDVGELSTKMDRIAELDQGMQVVQAEIAGSLKLLVAQTAGLPERVTSLELDRAKREGAGALGRSAERIVTASAGGVVGWFLTHFWKS